MSCWPILLPREPQPSRLHSPPAPAGRAPPGSPTPTATGSSWPGGRPAMLKRGHYAERRRHAVAGTSLGDAGDDPALDAAGLLAVPLQCVDGPADLAACLGECLARLGHQHGCRLVGALTQESRGALSISPRLAGTVRLQAGNAPAAASMASWTSALSASWTVPASRPLPGSVTASWPARPRRCSPLMNSKGVGLHGLGAWVSGHSWLR